MYKYIEITNKDKKKTFDFKLRTTIIVVKYIKV